MQRELSLCLFLTLAINLTIAEKDIEAPEKFDIFEINERSQAYLVDGDVIKESETRNTKTDPDRWWTSSEIPVSYANGLDLEAVESINEARVEYEIRTCLELVDRTTEPNYIMFEALDGCYSSVGMVGGEQTISIGSGCEKRATVQHEIMHAIGIWHEQSRADRDDYVKIEWQNIEAGHQHNFYNYGFDEADPLRVDYDYDSVMHYGDTSFSRNGEKTIVTRDPAFQDLIGQRRTFSEGDSTKINRMYNCSDTLRVTNYCGFESEDICGFIGPFLNSTADSTWTRHQVGKSASSSSKIPSTDSTVATEGSGSYMLFNPSINGDSADVTSMRYFNKRSNTQCLKLNYFMNLEADSTASIDLFIASIHNNTGEIIAMDQPMLSITENTQDYWQYLAMNVNAPTEYRFVLRGNSGGFVDDAIAFDDFSIQEKPCDTGYWQMDDFDEILATTAKGSFFYSPTMYTDEGYAYYLKIYPTGTSSSPEGYLSFYFGLAKGVNDDNLSWPMCNRFVRLQINDQNYNPLFAMDHYNNYVTSTSSTWEKPTSTRNSGYGYSKFIPLSELQSVNNYMKHNKVVFSVKVKDMNNVWGTSCNGQKSSSQSRNAGRSLEPNDKLLESSEITDQDWRQEEPTMLKGSVVASIAIASSLMVFFVMAILLMCVIKAQRDHLFAMLVARTANPRQSHTAHNISFVNKSADV